MLRPTFLLLFLAACGSFGTGASTPLADGGSSGDGAPPAGDGGGGDSGVGGPPGAGRCATVLPPDFCDDFDREGDALVPPWDYASAEGVSLLKEPGTTKGSLLIEVPPTSVNRPTYVFKSMARRPRLQFEAQVNFEQEGDGLITLLAVGFDGPTALDYQITVNRQFKTQPWKLQELKAGNPTRSTELVNTTFPATWTRIAGEIDLEGKRATLSIGTTPFALEGLDPPAGFTRFLVSLGLIQAANINFPYRIRFDDVFLGASR